MPHYMVFQQRLTDEQIDAVNLGQGSPEAAAYFKLHSLSESMAQRRVDVANSLGLYHMTAVANARDLEELFNVGNGYPNDPSSKYTRVKPWCGGTSVSVGNVVVDTFHNKAYACCSFGWQEIDFTVTFKAKG